MKKYIIYTLIVTIAVFLGSCNKDDIDTKRSIFDPTEVYEPKKTAIVTINVYIIYFFITYRFLFSSRVWF